MRNHWINKSDKDTPPKITASVDICYRIGHCSTGESPQGGSVCMNKPHTLAFPAAHTNEDNVFSEGNSIVPLVNGEAAYPEMIDAMSQARTSIALATYQFD